jgi:tetratricopeptide (TPR) repeat protein
MSGGLLHKHTAAQKFTPAPVKTSSLSEYMRTVYKISGENSRQQSDERVKLLEQSPELSKLSERVEKNPADREAMLHLVAAYMDHQLYWAAYEVLTNAQAVSPDDNAIDLNLARVWDVWGQYDLALKHAQRAATNGAVAAEAYEVLGRIHLHRKSPSEAIEAFTLAAKHGDSPAVLSNLGYAYMLVSNWERARSSFEEALELDPGIPEAHNNLAIVFSKLGDEGRALLELSKTGTQAVAFNNMGVLYLQEQRVEQARYFFEESVRLDPKYELAQRNLQALKAVTAPPAILHLGSFEDR